MATSSSGITEEENNYIRTFYLLLRVAPPVVREKFDREFYLGGLKTKLITKRFNVISPLCNKGIINKKQLALLYPGTGKLLLLLINVTISVKWTRNSISH
jgi:hypothetical protein